MSDRRYSADWRADFTAVPGQYSNQPWGMYVYLEEGFNIRDELTRLGNLDKGGSRRHGEHFTDRDLETVGRQMVQLKWFHRYSQEIEVVDVLDEDFATMKHAIDHHVGEPWCYYIEWKTDTDNPMEQWEAVELVRKSPSVKMVIAMPRELARDVQDLHEHVVCYDFTDKADLIREGYSIFFNDNDFFLYEANRNNPVFAGGQKGRGYWISVPMSDEIAYDYLRDSRVRKVKQRLIQDEELEI